LEGKKDRGFNRCDDKKYAKDANIFCRLKINNPEAELRDIQRLLILSFFENLGFSNFPILP
jgi:hypothetical protein